MSIGLSVHHGFGHDIQAAALVSLGGSCCAQGEGIGAQRHAGNWQHWRPLRTLNTSSLALPEAALLPTELLSAFWHLLHFSVPMPVTLTYSVSLLQELSPHLSSGTGKLDDPHHVTAPTGRRGRLGDEPQAEDKGSTWQVAHTHTPLLIVKSL